MLVSSAAEATEFTGMQYFVGEFDGKSFVPDKQEGVLRLDRGKDFYAAIPFQNLPSKDKNPIIMGWGSNWSYAGDIPSEGRRGMFSMPRKLSLIKESGQFSLVQKPIYSSRIHVEKLILKASELTKPKTLEMKNNTYKLSLAIDLENSNGFAMDLLKNKEEKCVLTYHAKTQKLFFDRTKSGKVDFNKNFSSIESMQVAPQNGVLKLDIFVDNSIVEVFADEGKAVLTDLVFPKKNGGKIILSLLKD
jgi:fructan beta-fructosidase